MLITGLLLAPALIWVALLLLPSRPWGTQEHLETATFPGGEDVSDITIVIPARNEAQCIDAILKALPATQSVIVVDDDSTDGTAQIAKAFSNVRVVQAAALPNEWAGKLWALENGRQHATSRLVLLLDADIELSPGMIGSLKAKLDRSNLHLVSVMAELRMETFWEKLFVPAFVYFFKLLYPFAKSNDPRSRVAAAAGGCMLVQREALEKIGGFSAIRGALIDDCALAAKFKAHGFRTWMGLSRGARSHRAYGLASFWNMVARSAFTQLRYSAGLLLVTTFGLVLLFVAPVAGIRSPNPLNRAAGLLALSAMGITYLPMLRYYGRSPLWALALPLVAPLYLAMTWTSAIRCWRGRRAEWKGRVYGSGFDTKTLPRDAASL